MFTWPFLFQNSFSVSWLLLSVCCFHCVGMLKQVCNEWGRHYIKSQPWTLSLLGLNTWSTYNNSWWSNSRTSLLFIWGGPDPHLMTSNSIKWGKNSGRSDVLFGSNWFFTSRMLDSMCLKCSAHLDQFNWFEPKEGFFTWAPAQEPYALLLHNVLILGVKKLL